MSYVINKLKVDNFRNLFSDIIEFSSGINCISGDNGNGKTNILEAVHVLFTRKSFRKGAGFPQFLDIDGSKAEIIFTSVLNRRGKEHLGDISYTGRLGSGISEWYFNGKVSKGRLEVPIVFINPFDSYSFHTTPAVRRTWFDRHISMFDICYKRELSKHRGFLRARNELIGKIGGYNDQLGALDRELAKCSLEILKKRQEFIALLVPIQCRIFKKLFSQDHALDARVGSKAEGMSVEEFLYAMRNNWDKDRILGYTTYGIHRDDYELFFDGLSSLDYCSLGQLKMSYLSLLFAYIELFRYKCSTSPVVLIDDVSGELDHLRWEQLVGYLGESDFQVLITTANEKFKEELERISGAGRLSVSSGRVECTIN